MRPHNLDKKLILNTLNPQIIPQIQNYQTQIRSVASESVEILEVNIKNTTKKPLKNWYLNIGQKIFYPTEILELEAGQETKTKVQSSDNLEKLTQKTDPAEIIDCKECEISLGESSIEISKYQENWLNADIYRQQQNFELASYNKFANPLLVSSFLWKKTPQPNCEKTVNTKTCTVAVDFLYFETKQITELVYGKTAKLIYSELKNPKFEEQLEGELWLTASVNYDLDYQLIRQIVKNNDPETAKTQLQETFPNLKKIEFYNTGLPIDFRFLYIETK